LEQVFRIDFVKVGNFTPEPGNDANRHIRILWEHG
jgi:hypothetical protein